MIAHFGIESSQYQCQDSTEFAVKPKKKKPFEIHVHRESESEKKTEKKWH